MCTQVLKGWTFDPLPQDRGFLGHFTSRFIQHLLPIHVSFHFSFAEILSVEAVIQTQVTGIRAECLISELLCAQQKNDEAYEE